MYTNVNRIIYVAADVCYLYIQKTYILYFPHQQRCHLIPRSISHFVNFQDQFFHIQKGTQMNSYDRFIQY